MLSINTDQNSIKIQHRLSNLTAGIVNASKRLSSGQKINSAKDNAANLFISSGISSRIRALNEGTEAAQTGINILNIAGSALTNIQNALLRIRDLSVSASNDYYTTDARSAMQSEANALIEEITKEKDGCNFNGINLLNSSSDTHSAETEVSEFKQLTIDDFDNIQTQTLSSVEFQKGERNGDTYYFVENINQLRVVAQSYNRDASDKNFVFLSDIDLTGVVWGTNYVCKANIDGNGHTISNYHSEVRNSALFFRNYGTIKNLGMTNCENKVGSAAILCNYNNGIIDNCNVSNSTVAGNSSGIFCHYNYGTISNSYVTNSTVSGNMSALFCPQNNGTISNSNVKDSVVKGVRSSAFCYNNSRSTDEKKCIIENCYVENTTTEGDYSSIICYVNQSTITNCYVTKSSVKGNESAIFCWRNNSYEKSEITNCYVTNSAIEGQESAVFCVLNRGSISNTYTMNIKTPENIYYIDEQTGNISNNYQNYNESDTFAAYRVSGWFATDDAQNELDTAFEILDYKDHPTLKSNPEPSGNNKMRIQTGYYRNYYSNIMLDLGFDLGTITIDLSTAENAANSIDTVDNLLKIINDKKSEYGSMYNRLDSVVKSNTMSAENLSSARSELVDADIAKEKADYIKKRILQSAASSLLTQTANINSQIILGLIRNL